MVKGKLSSLTVIITSLTVALVMYSFKVWFNDLRNMTATLVIAGIGLYITNRNALFTGYNHAISLGFLWAGIILVIIAAFLSWNLFSERLRPFILLGLLTIAVWFGTKHKNYLI